MKKKICSIICSIVSVVLCACSTQHNLVEMNTKEENSYVAIIWDDKTYVPYCAFSKSDCGRQIGIVDADCETYNIPMDL